MGRPKLTTEVITRFVNANGNKYNYSKVKYTGAKDKLIVICAVHGDFNVILDKHMLGSNCPKCTAIQYHNVFKKDTEYFIDKSKLIHGDKYDYSKVIYHNNKEKVIITCPIHGDFKQRASSHMRGGSCFMCKESVGERIIRNELLKNKINFILQHRFVDCFNLKPLPFDFYLPNHNVCIEFNGRQHYEHNNFFVSKKGFEELQNRDAIKVKYCEDKKIGLIIIKHSDNILDKLKHII